MLILAIVISIGLIGLIAAYLATKGDTDIMKILPFAIAIIAIVSNLIVLSNVEGLSIEYDTTITEVNDTSTTVSSTINYALPTEIETIINNLITILVLMLTPLAIIMFYFLFFKTIKNALMGGKK